MRTMPDIEGHRVELLTKLLKMAEVISGCMSTDVFLSPFFCN